LPKSVCLYELGCDFPGCVALHAGSIGACAQLGAARGKVRLVGADALKGADGLYEVSAHEHAAKERESFIDPKNSGEMPRQIREGLERGSVLPDEPLA